MYDSPTSSPSALVAAVNRLSATPAKTIRDDTYFRLPVTMKIGDADLCTYLGRNEGGFLFLPNHDKFTTQLILSTTNEAWQHDKLPALAICPTEHSANAVQKSTGIESISAERFFADLDLARPVTQTFTGKSSYVIGHDHNPKGRFDDIVLPTFANVIVHEADKFSAAELTSICDHVAQVSGKVILCADWSAIDRAHPDIAPTISAALGRGLPDVSVGDNPEKAWELGNELESYSTVGDGLPQSGDSKPWVVVANCWWEIGANVVRSIHSSQAEALNAVPAVFAEEWKDYVFFFQADRTDYEPPTVSAAEWRVPTPPEIGDRVRIEDHAAVSLISLDERLPLPDSLQPDTPESDPLAKSRSFLVYHTKTDDARLFPDHYKLVAKIEAESIDHALFLSQHTESSWTRNRGVTAFDDNPRSTQVGDVIIDHDVPKRYAGPATWRPATTEMDPVHVNPIASDLNANVSRPAAHEQNVPAQNLKMTL